jgi:mono/diheme cytochrome c family protein
MDRKIAALTFAVATTMAAGPEVARAEVAGDPNRGHDLAQALCSSCHLVDESQRGPVPDGVPSFMAIAGQPGVTADRLLGKLLTPPHPAMPEPPLEQVQMRDILAYILSLP